MKAVVQQSYGFDAIEVAERPIPEPGEGQVRVRMESASLNPADWYKAAGTPPFLRLSEGFLRPKLEIIGTDGAGVVDALGPNSGDFEVGDRVFGKFLGSFAEFATAETERLARTPDNVSSESAAGLPIAGVTALQAVEKGEVDGQRVAVNGASGGVGAYAVQIAKAMGAAHVTGVCSAANAEMVRSLGADDVIDYKTDNFTTRDFDVLIDCVATQSAADVRRCLGDEGRWVLIGAVKGEGILGPVPTLVGLMLKGIFSKPKPISFIADETAERLTRLVGLAEQGKLRTVVDRTHSLDESRKAYDYLGTHRARGKVIFSIAP
ncbi:MAG: NAD(P)-dependent alcohol dehydrogenase [Acidimicrobiia bacterium]